MSFKNGLSDQITKTKPLALFCYMRPLKACIFIEHGPKKFPLNLNKLNRPARILRQLNSQHRNNPKCNSSMKLSKYSRHYTKKKSINQNIQGQQIKCKARGTFWDFIPKRDRIPLNKVQQNQTVQKTLFQKETAYYQPTKRL